MNVNDLERLKDSVKLGKWITYDQQRMLEELGIEVYSLPTSDRTTRRMQVENVRYILDRMIEKERRRDKVLKMVALVTAVYLIGCYVSLFTESCK